MTLVVKRIDNTKKFRGVIVNDVVLEASCLGNLTTPKVKITQILQVGWSLQHWNVLDQATKLTTTGTSYCQCGSFINDLDEKMNNIIIIAAKKK